MSKLMRLQVVSAKGMKMFVFWDAVPCNLAETDRRFGCDYCLHHQDLMHLRKVDTFLPDYMALHPRRRPS